jgi:hypothetical protein
MKQLLCIFIFLPVFVFAQEATVVKPNIAIKWAPAGLYVGSFNLHGEYNFGKNSLTAKIGIPVKAQRSFKYDGNDADFVMRATSFMAGYRTYLSKKHMKGFYFEPYFKYVHHSSEGYGYGKLDGEPVVMNFTNDYNGIGIGAELGFQFMIKDLIVVDIFFLGPELNSGRNNFVAIESSRVLPWTSVQASEAENDIRNLIDDIPFVRKHTDVMVDKNNKTVRADFKGIIPGYRAGISFGVAF